MVQSENKEIDIKEAVKEIFKVTVDYHCSTSSIDKDKVLKVTPLNEEEILKENRDKYEIGN